MSAPHTASICNRTCQDFIDHARHDCCVVCNPPSNPSTPPPPQCPSHAALEARVAELSAEVADLRSLVEDLFDELAGCSEDEES